MNPRPQRITFFSKRVTGLRKMGHNGTNHGLFSVNPAQVYKARQAEEERGGGASKETAG